jgi:hypothetical protein
MTSSTVLVDNALAAVRLPDDRFASFVMTRWTEVVGPEVSRFAIPTAIRAGTLWLRPQSREARFALTPLADAIRAAIARATGSTRITAVKFVED